MPTELSTNKQVMQEAFSYRLGVSSDSKVSLGRQADRLKAEASIRWSTKLYTKTSEVSPFSAGCHFWSEAQGWSPGRSADPLSAGCRQRPAVLFPATTSAGTSSTWQWLVCGGLRRRWCSARSSAYAQGTVGGCQPRRELVMTYG